MNKDNIKRLIECIEAERPELCIMNSYDQQMECGTAHCIGGWIDVLMNIERGLEYKSHITGDDRAAWLDISTYELAVIEGMHDAPIPTDKFDNLEPEVRKRYMLNLLHILLSTGKVNWHKALL